MPPKYKLHLEAKLPMFRIFITLLHIPWCSCFLSDLSWKTKDLLATDVPVLWVYGTYPGRTSSQRAFASGRRGKREKQPDTAPADPPAESRSWTALTSRVLRYKWGGGNSEPTGRKAHHGLSPRLSQTLESTRFLIPFRAALILHFFSPSISKEKKSVNY